MGKQIQPAWPHSTGASTPAARDSRLPPHAGGGDATALDLLSATALARLSGLRSSDISRTVPGASRMPGSPDACGANLDRKPDRHHSTGRKTLPGLRSEGCSSAREDLDARGLRRRLAASLRIAAWEDAICRGR